MSTVRNTVLSLFFRKHRQPKLGHEEYYGWYSGKSDEGYGCTIYRSKNNEAVKITYATKNPGDPYDKPNNDYKGTATYIGVIIGEPLFHRDPDPITAVYKTLK